MSGILLREAILPRIDGIQRNLERLRRLGALEFEEFRAEDNFALAQHYLRLSLEGVFHIANHILARLPGGRATEYKTIARRLGELGVVPGELAEQKLVPMAGLRNLLVHDYDDIDEARLHALLREHLGDFDEYLRHISELMQDPGRLGLKVN